ncbi:MAG TPA: protein kinase family protein [Angustibacter sp.]|nr:protein kinase family protein [Angustibacter sp.]
MGPGSSLGGRYVLRERLEDSALSSSWQAHDDVLDRRVHLRAVSSDHPHAAAVLDAARRAAAVEDARLVRVLDVGEDDGVTFVVSEWLPTASLAHRLRGGPLPPSVARTVVGEAALALEAARHRGLHHLRLTPERVHVLDDGTVKVTELATAAALDGLDVGDDADSTMDGEQATALDTRDLIALAYATLTATWPLPTPSDLPQAPHVGGHPVPPSQIVTGAPADLDTLCAQTFAGAGAPDTPGELAGQIAPWGRERREERAGGAFPHLLAPTPRPPLPTATPAAPLPAPEPPTQQLRPATPSGPAPATETTSVFPVQPFAPEPASPTAPGLPVGGLDVLYDDLEHEEEHQAPAEDPQARSQTRTVLVLVAVFVAIFLVLAYCGLRGLGENAFVPAPSKGSSSSSAPSPSPSATQSSSTSTTSSPPAGPIPVSSASGFDPQGDGEEKNDLAPKAIDGNASTQWTSDTYKTAQFGGLKKGVGLALDLGRRQPVTSVTVRVGAGGGTFQLRTASGDQLGSTVLAEVSDAAGTVTLTPQKPVTADRLVIWCTQAPQVSGGFRVEIAEVTVR